MKDSGIEWIGEIPEDWEVKRIQWGLTEVIKKNDPIKADNILSLTKDKGVIPYEDKGNLGNKSKTNLADYKLAYRNSIVMNSMNVIIGSVGLSDYFGCVSPVYYVFKAEKNNDIRFFNYIFQMQVFQSILKKYANGILEIRLRVSSNDVLKRNIPFPNYKEQIKISNYLDKKTKQIEDIKNKISEEIENLESYKKSVITEAVTKGLDKNVEMKDSGIEWIGEIPKHWNMLRIKNLGICRNGLTYSPSDTCDEKDGTLVLRSSNVQNGKIVLNNNVYVKKRIPDYLMVKNGDILICSRNGSKELIGKNAIINNIDATFGAFMMIYRSKNPKLMYYVLNSNIFQYYLGTFFTSTINQLTNSNFENMKIVWCDDINEQEQIVIYLDKKTKLIDDSISLKQKQLETLEEYKKSLIYEYVTGKKEVKDGEET